MASDRRQQRDLEDAAFTVEQQHKAVMDETHRLYTEIITSYQSAHHCWVPHSLRSPPSVRHPGEQCLMSVFCLCGQMSNVSQRSKEETVQRLEDEKLCSQETKNLDHLLSENHQLIERTEAKVKQTRKLQVN